MKAFEEFTEAPAEFWAFVKFISERLGYTKRKTGLVASYSYEEIENLCRNTNTYINADVINDAVIYTDMRASILNNFVNSNLMNVDEASEVFEIVHSFHRDNHFQCKLPLNKQKGDMKRIAYFTAIINILTEKTLREITGRRQGSLFDDDPHGLVYVRDERGNIIGVLSRRFDGAFPCVSNPSIVWEIKEYYYATTFGSRIADGVYETQLDGYEIKDIYSRSGCKIYHVLFVDAYRTWWEQGKSYLCRLVDALNSGAVDEIIIGREVLNRWPQLLHEVIET